MGKSRKIDESESFHVSSLEKISLFNLAWLFVVSCLQKFEEFWTFSSSCYKLEKLSIVFILYCRGYLHKFLIFFLLVFHLIAQYIYYFFVHERTTFSFHFSTNATKHRLKRRNEFGSTFFYIFCFSSSSVEILFSTFRLVLRATMQEHSSSALGIIKFRFNQFGSVRRKWDEWMGCFEVSEFSSENFHSQRVRMRDFLSFRVLVCSYFTSVSRPASVCKRSSSTKTFGARNKFSLIPTSCLYSSSSWQWAQQFHDKNTQLGFIINNLTLCDLISHEIREFVVFIFGQVITHSMSSFGKMKNWAADRSLIWQLMMTHIDCEIF